MDAHAEAYVDGELSPDERARFERRLHASPLWQTCVQQARSLQQELNTLPQPACPPHVADAVHAEVRRRQRALRPERGAKRLRRLRKPAAWRPALAAGVLLVLALSALLLSRPPAPQAQPSFTEAEVERATAEVAWTLTYLAQIGERTGQAVEEALPDSRLIRSTRLALEPVLGPPTSEAPDPQP